MPTVVNAKPNAFMRCNCCVQCQQSSMSVRNLNSVNSAGIPSSSLGLFYHYGDGLSPGLVWNSRAVRAMGCTAVFQCAR